jgi:Rieske Fe-S protein
MTTDRSTLPDGTPDQVDPNDQAVLDFWCEHFGCTVQQLQEAVRATGRDPVAVREHLLQQGSSAGAG